MIVTIIYLPTIPLIMSFIGIPKTYLIIYLIASTQIIENHLITMLEACLQAKIPQTLGYGLLIEEFSKVALAYVLIIKLQQPLIGALLSIAIAFAVQIAYYFKLLSKELWQPIKWSYIKEWLKGSTLYIYYSVGTKIAGLVLVMLIAYNPIVGQEARGQYEAALNIATIITTSLSVSVALYPRLLAENKLQGITASLKAVLMFAIPMTVGAIMMAGSYLIIQQPTTQVYLAAVPVLVILAVDFFVQVISGFYQSVLFGIEKADEKSKIPLKKLVKSPLFKAFTLPYVQSAIALPATFYLLTNFAKDQAISAAMYVGIVDTVAHLATFLALYTIIWKMVKIDIPWMNIAKYIVASAFMALFLFLIPQQTKLASILGITIIAGIIYFALLAAIDKETRGLIRSIWQEIKFRL
jgi:hypothetical protein